MGAEAMSGTPAAPEPRPAFVELRVHGVGGASPTWTLDDPDVVQVAGDDTAGFFRGRRQPATLEAYSWGGLTSGSAIGVLWVLLLPFAVANIAGFLFPWPAAERPRRQAVYVGAVRVFALVITVVYTLWFAEFAMEHVAYQILGEATLDPGAFLHVLHGRPGWRVAGGLGAAVVAVGLLHFIVHRSRGHYDDYGAEACVVGRDPARTLTLGDAGFWAPHDLAPSLAWVHAAASLATLSLCASLASRYLGVTAPRGLEWLLSGQWVVGQVLLLGAIGCLAAAPYGPRTTDLARIGWLLAGASLTIGIVLLTQATPSKVDVPFTIWDWPIRGTAVVGVLAVLAMSVSSAPTSRAELSSRGWATGAALAAYATSMITVHLGGATIALQAGDRLGALVVPPVVVKVPQFFYVQGLVTLVGVCLAALAMVALFVGTTSERRSQLLDRQARVCVLVGVGLALVLHVAYAAWVLIFGDLPVAGDKVVWAGRWATSILTLLGIGALLGYWRAAVVDSELRRNVGRVWDVLTFWPRWFHPLAPPAYAQRAVPELQARVRELLQEDGARVLLAAHSQGSVIAFAALLGLDDATRRRVWLLTHGSPLRRVYRDFFPAWFRTEDFATVRASLPGWTNLWRRTDPIGGEVFDGQAERVDDPDPACLPPRLEGARRFRSRAWRGRELGHSYYEHHPRYGEAVARARAAPPTADGGDRA